MNQPLDPNPNSGKSKKQANAVFLHTGWRSVGTWVWACFRDLPEVSAFYEPLHPILSELLLADLPAFKPDWTSGHSALSAPYFDEYRPFINASGQGVIGYQKSFSVDRFGSVPAADFAALRDYLSSLCTGTTGNGKVPVFKFCRSGGRLPWLKTAFPDALHAVVLRNPASQFASGWLLLQGWQNPYFVAAPFRLLGLNQTDPLVREVISLFEVQLPLVPVRSADDYGQACEHFARSVEGANAYRAFIALWTLCALRSVNADLLIDMDRLGESADYRQSLNRAVLAHTGLRPDFDGTRDLLKETRDAVTEMQGIDGRAVAPIHSVALKFLAAHLESLPNQPIADAIKAKIMLARQLSDKWRY